MIVKLKRKHHSLTLGQRYPVIGIEADSYRIINNQGGPYLYEPGLFTVVDKSMPRDWVVEKGDEGEVYAYPREFHRPGFFEDYHDGESKAMSTFWRLVNGRLARAS